MAIKLHARWEKDFSGKRVARRHDLSTMMDPKIRIREARDLNNNLMKWRVATGIDLDIIKRAKVLVLGMGTLGCGVVRTLIVPNPYPPISALCLLWLWGSFCFSLDWG